MKKTMLEKLAVVDDAVSQINFGGLMVLQFFVMILIWVMLSGSEQLIGSLPNWALAVAGGGAVCLLFSAFLLKIPKLIFAPLGMIALLAVQIGSASVLAGDPSESIKIGNGQLPSFADLVQGFSWMVIIGLAVGGLFSLALVAESKTQKIDPAKN